MQDRGYELPRITLPRTWVNSDTKGRTSMAQKGLEGTMPFRTHQRKRSGWVLAEDVIGWRGQRVRTRRGTGGSRERVAPSSTLLYGGSRGRRICRVATLRSTRWPLSRGEVRARLQPVSYLSRVRSQPMVAERFRASIEHDARRGRSATE